MTEKTALSVPPATQLDPVDQLRPTDDPVAVYLAGVATSSRAVATRRLRAVARMIAPDGAAVPWHALRYPHLVAIREQLLARGLAPATVNLTLSVLRGVAREAWNLGYLSPEEYERIRQIKPARGERLPTGRSASQGELRALLDVCTADRTPAGARDAAIIAVLYAGGLRRAELAGLELADWSPEQAALRVRHGKGNKQRQIYLVHGAADALADWLTVRGSWPGCLFLPINKGGTISGTQLTAQAIYGVLRKRAAEAGIPHLSPHDLRRTFVGDLLDAGVDISTVQQLAGHANVTTTARYDRRGEVAKQQAVARLHVPYAHTRRGARAEQ
jgi:site-specific recombinase XerD